MTTQETVMLDPHIAWAIFCLLLALIAAAVALAIGLTERRR